MRIDEVTMLNENAYGQEFHGMEGVYIWVGRTDKRHGHRVKISNVRGKYRNSNSFVIQMPGYYYNPRHVAQWIDDHYINDIIDWLTLNAQVLHDFMDGKIGTDDLERKLVKVAK